MERLLFWKKTSRFLHRDAEVAFTGSYAGSEIVASFTEIYLSLPEQQKQEQEDGETFILEKNSRFRHRDAEVAFTGSYAGSEIVFSFTEISERTTDKKGKRLHKTTNPRTFGIRCAYGCVKDEDEDDEVFVGPVRHKEKCVSAGIEKQTNVTESKTETIPTGSWSPISGDKFVEIFKEAHFLARQFEESGVDFVQPEKRTVKNEVVEKFVENSKAKLNILHKAKEHVISPVKRDTFCVWDSPLKQLPPAIQQRLLSSNTAASPSKINASASSPAKVCKTQQQKQSTGSSANVCKKEATLSYSKRIPLSKAVSSKAGGKSGHVAAEKPRTGIKSSSSRRRHNSSACSSEDLHSDNASIASDISESSLNGSILGKRTVPVSNKIGLRKSYGTKPAVQHRGVGVATRRNTSSSSSSLSSMNSSMNSSISVSPTGKGKTNSPVSEFLS
ncbi:UNVERIFIED_CONTAM: hypothetical protein FKN15_036695 [Acipenser sinensis]